MNGSRILALCRHLLLNLVIAHVGDRHKLRASLQLIDDSQDALDTSTIPDYTKSYHVDYLLRLIDRK